MCSDEEIGKQSKMDVARILVRTKYTLVLSETFNDGINNYIFRIKMIEDLKGLFRVVILNIMKGEGEKK